MFTTKTRTLFNFINFLIQMSINYSYFGHLTNKQKIDFEINNEQFVFRLSEKEKIAWLQAIISKF